LAAPASINKREVVMCRQVGWLIVVAACAIRLAGAEESRALRDDGIYQDGGYWATPLPWLMVTVMREDPARAARLFCEAVEDFQARKDINEWVNDQAVTRRRGVRDYCASAAMPLAGVRRLRAYLAEKGTRLPPELAHRLDTDEAWLKQEARRVLRGSSRLGNGGVRIFTPDATGGYGAFWVRDWSYAIEGCPDVFAPAEVRDGYLFLAAAQRRDGCMPDRVAVDGHGIFSPGGEKNPLSAHGSVDQSPFMVILCHQYWKLHADLEPFRKTAAALEKGMRFTPRNPANGLVQITDAKVFRPYSFLDTVPLVGDQQFDSILFWDACAKLAEMFDAAGQPAQAAPWRREADRVKTSLASLWDEKLGLFVAASVRWRQPSIWGSVFAVYTGLATPDQTRRIVRYCLEQQDAFVFRGQVRHLPKGTFWGKPEPQSSDRSATAKTVSVADYGAMGSGQRDDAPAIQKALDSGAAVVALPAGVYRIGETLWIGSNVTLKADPQAVIRLADGAGKHVNVFLLANRNPGNGNQHIAVEGGIWDGNNERNRRGKDGDQLAYTGSAINFVNVKHLAVRKLTVRNPEAFSVRLGEVEDFLVEDIVLDHPVPRPNQDGIHVGGFSQRGVIRRIQGVTPNTPNDDMVALNADDDVERALNLGMRRGPIRDVLVEDLQADGAYTFVRIMSAGSPVEKITVRRVKGSCRFYAVNMNQWRFPVGSGNIRNVRLEDFQVTKTVYKDWAPSLIHVTLSVRDLSIRNFQRGDEPRAAQASTLFVSNGKANTIQSEGGKPRSLATFTVPQGNIRQLWINRSSEPPR
jgi:hypothetical protein